jgi:hypothetical protein
MGVPRTGFPQALKKLFNYLDGTGPSLGLGVNVAAENTTPTGLSVTDEGVGPLRKTIITMVDMPVEVVSVTTGNGVGGTQLLDFPAGRLVHFATMGQLSIRVATANQADFTDGTPEGQIGIGTVAPANADALGTDATDDDFGTAADFTMTDYADASVSIQSEAIQQFDGTSTAKNLFLNVLVDAADIEDDTTTEVLVSGTIVVHWLNAGDVT